MLQGLANILIPLITLLAVVFVIIRLRFFSEEQPDGRYLVLTGGILVVVASGWQVVKGLADYPNWFIVTAYPYIDMVQVAVFAVGLLCIVAALAFYHDFWHMHREEVSARQGKMVILEHLIEDARRPYQVVDLLNIGLKETLLNFPGCAGVVFLIHRTRRQFILISSAGLNKTETAMMEYFPLRRNVVSQAIELGEPVSAREFPMFDREGQAVVSRFGSSLVLPLVSGREKLGGIILLSEESNEFTSWDIRALTPIASWLAEKVHATRLSRELASVTTRFENLATERDDLSRRLNKIVHAMSGADVIADVCRSLIGVASADSVHLCGLRRGALHFHGGSEPLFDLSENFRAALVDALDRSKPLILNQEALDDDGNSVVVSSSLILPLRLADSSDALLLRKDAPPFAVGEAELKKLELYVSLAAFALGQSDSRRRDLSRRAGFEKVIQLLSADDVPLEPLASGQYFADQIAQILPTPNQTVVLRCTDDGSLEGTGGQVADSEALHRLRIKPGEGIIGTALLSRQVEFVWGKKQVNDELGRFNSDTRSLLFRIFGEAGVPGFLFVCPVGTLDKLQGVVVWAVQDMPSPQRVEWERLLTLASGLYSLRLTVGNLLQAPSVAKVEASVPGDVINRLNNHLLAIMGRAELVHTSGSLNADARTRVEEILVELDKAARLVRHELASTEKPTGEKKEAPRAEPALNTVIEEALADVRISGNVYMTGGRPREIDLNLHNVGDIPLSSDAIRSLFDSALNRFAALSDEDEVITVNSYELDGYVYVDISRHPRNFPPVHQVAGFGQYETPEDASAQRPGDVFLQQLAEKPAYYAHDRLSEVPAFLSFKFALKGDKAAPANTTTAPFSILAIDDEAVILDLISAMGQSLGYAITTASSGEEGLRKAETQRFDLVLTDLAMPGMSGLEVARELKRRRNDLPIVLVTGWQSSLSDDELRIAGISRVLSKPFRIEQLTDIVQTLASRRNS